MPKRPAASKEEAEAGAGAGRGAVGRLVDCSQADDRRMIRLVRERPLLFARNNMPVARFYSQVKGLWAEVAREMGWTVVDVRRKWSHIRNSYSRHLRNELHGVRTGRGRAVSRWYLADELDFLRDHMATDMRPAPFSSITPSLLDMEKNETSGLENSDVHTFMNSSWFNFSGRSPATSHKSFDPKRELSNDESSSSAFESEENTSFFQFFRGIHQDYLELPVKKQRLFKRKCLDFLHELLDEDQGPASMVYQDDAINLTRERSESEEEVDSKAEVYNQLKIEKVESNAERTYV